PRPDVSNAAFITNHNDFGAAFDSAAIITAGGGAAPRSRLQKENFTNAAVAADTVADLGEHAGHLSIFGIQDAFARDEQLEENRPQQRSAQDSAHNRQEKNHRCDENTVAMQQVARSPKPAEECSKGETIDSGEAVGATAVGARAVVGQRGVADVKMSEVEVCGASQHRDYAEDETDAEADEIEGVHGHWAPRFVRWFVVTG